MSHHAGTRSLCLMLLLLTLAGCGGVGSQSPSSDPVASFRDVSEKAIGAMRQALSGPIAYTSEEHKYEGGRSWDVKYEMTIGECVLQLDKEIEVEKTNSLTTPYKGGFAFTIDFKVTAKGRPSEIGEGRMAGVVYYNRRDDGLWRPDRLSLAGFVEYGGESSYRFDHSDADQVLQERLWKAVDSIPPQ